MSDPRTSRGGASGLAPSMRGAAVIGLAVIAGVVGLQALDDASPARVDSTTSTTATTSSTVAGSSSTAAGGAASSTTQRSTTTTRRSGSSSSTTTTVPLRAAKDVAVWVANGSGQTGQASVIQQKLKGLGYNTLGISNAPDRTGTVVQCKAGYEREGAAIAAEVATGAKVEGFPSSLPASGAESANCLVVLGK